ncbi:MAG: V-type ATPase subunit, partial [Euryarchaeota archaeon]|nr:V-type ATPase subunit [Euryarchaeota archaeon]
MSSGYSYSGLLFSLLIIVILFATVFAFIPIKSVEVVVLVIVGAIVGVAVALPFTFVGGSAASIYAYPIVRVAAMRSRLVTESKIDEIVRAENLAEIIAILEGTDCGKHLNQAMSEYDKIGVIALERSLNQHLVDVYKTTLGIVPDEIKSLLKMLARKWEIKNLKTIFRAKHVGLPKKELEASLLPFEGLLHSGLVKQIIEVESIEEIFRLLSDMKYGIILKEAIEEYQKRKSLVIIDAALDRYYYGETAKVLYQLGVRGRDVKRLFELEVDITNLKIILRCKKENIPKEEVAKFLIPFGFELVGKRLEELIEAENIETVLSRLEGTSYIEILNAVRTEYEKTGSLLP